MTISGEGTVSAVAETPADYSMVIWAKGNSKVIIDGGTFRNEGDSTDLIYVSENGNVEIHGGEFIPSGPANTSDGNGTSNPYVALNCKDSAYKAGTASIKVMGGRFFCFNPANNLSEGANTNYVAEGYKVVVDGVENTEAYDISMGEVWYEVIPE